MGWVLLRDITEWLLVGVCLLQTVIIVLLAKKLRCYEAYIREHFVS